MKKYILICIVIGLVFLNSCEKHSYVSFGFKSEITKNSTGLDVFHVSRYVDDIYMVGSVQLSEGSVVVQLIDPDGDFAHLDTVRAPESFSVNRYYNSKSGYWKLKYESIDAVGEIDLHVIF